MRRFIWSIAVAAISRKASSLALLIGCGMTAKA